MYCSKCNCIDCSKKNYIKKLTEKGLKQCTKCNQVKELQFFDYRDKKRSGNSRRGDCKDCRKAYNARFFKEKQAKKKEKKECIKWFNEKIAQKN